MTLSVIRPVTVDDFDQLLALARQSDGGMTNLPSDADALRPRVEFAASCFENNPTAPNGEVYQLVLEENGKIMGTSAVFSAIGLDHGFVNYRINRTVHVSTQLRKRIERRLLVPTHDFTGCAEVGSLFLSKDARGGGRGKFLSRVRYLFIAGHRKLIADSICAELRGWRGKDGEQPFWDAIGKPFFDMDFEAADVANSAMGNQFISDLLPRHPIYVALLPKEARDILGKPHANAEPAQRLLINEGFAYRGYIDVFDGGPLLDVGTDEIKTVRESKKYTVRLGGDESAAPMMIAAGRLSAFRAIFVPASIQDETISISKEAMAALNVSENEHVTAVA